MTRAITCRSVWNNSQGKLLILWFGLDGVLYLGALMAMVLALTDPARRPMAYAFTIALVVSWALRMAYGIWLELGRVRLVEREKADRISEILKKHGLSEDESASAIRELGHLA